MILMIDNYDSFTYNLVQYLAELGAELNVYRNDKLTLNDIESMNPEKIIISPGPGRPESAGISVDIIKNFAKSIPILGVCLGHQCIGHAFKSKIIRADKLMHGKTSMIYHDKKNIYKDINDPFEATRYHSLIIKKDTLPNCFSITSWTKEKEIMGIQHNEYPLFGMQYHPESILTKEGKNLLKNFLEFTS